VKTFQLPAILDSFRSMSDRGLKVTFTTGELSPQQMADVQWSFQKAGFLAFSPDPFATAELEEIDKLKVEFTDTGKPASQRMRAVLYKLYELDKEGYKAFSDYYTAKMEQLIEHFKSRLA
jgi:hypothetical protein